MKKEIREVDKKQGIIQITTVDERWYIKSTSNKKTKNLEYKFVPSVTWIADSYPKGIGYFKWLAQKGWDEAESLKKEAGEKGSKVHLAIEKLIAGEKVKMEDKFLNKDKDTEEELSLEEWECLMSFSEWFNKVKPEVLANEVVVWNDKDNYAGTVDLLAVIDNKVWLIDFKTSQNIWPSHEIQIAAYKHALKNKDFRIKDVSKIRLAILQIGYKRNKKSYKFTEIEDKFDLFLAAKAIWANDHNTEKPSQKDYPVELKLELKVDKKTNKKKNQNGRVKKISKK